MKQPRRLPEPEQGNKVPEDRGMTTEEFEACHGRAPEVDDIFAAWRRLPTRKSRP